ncbi:hypothetical protein AB1L42_19805 [Thalassoglobus sp. JC818]|uniref:hypothetical protein n=1 Tax=Thalassoglobus sp. JC818 TaxID=3232136 RepID=UPI0034580821
MSHIDDDHSSATGRRSISSLVASSPGIATASLEEKYQHWQSLWNSKQEVIDSLLDELEKTMEMSQRLSTTSLRIIDTNSDHSESV